MTPRNAAKPGGTRISRRAVVAGAGAGVLGYAIAVAGGRDPFLGRAAAAVGPEGTAYTGLGRGGLLVHSGTGPIGLYEAVMPVPGSGVESMARDNNVPALAWNQPVWAGYTRYPPTGVAALWSTYGTGHLELAVVAGGQVTTHWRDDSGWHQLGAVPGITDAVGWPGYIQSTFGGFGNFELVVPSSSGGLITAWRDNDAAQGFPWTLLPRFGSGVYQAAALIQSNFVTGESDGNLEVIALKNGVLEHWYRDHELVWHLGNPAVATGVGGAPSLAQSTFLEKGNFEVVAPLLGGGIAHWWRNNDITEQPWSQGGSFGGRVRYAATGLVAGPLGPQRNNLEVLGLRTGWARADHYYRDGIAAWRSNGTFWSRVTGPASTYGSVDGTVDLGMLGIASVLLPNGKALLWGFKPQQSGTDQAQATLFQPSTRAVEAVPDPPHNVFCAGQANLPDGRVLIVGGHSDAGLESVTTYDPGTNSFTSHGAMPGGQGRWYPTITVLPDGRALVIAGTTGAGVGEPYNSTYQIWSGSGLGPQHATPVPFSSTWPADDTVIHWYPYVFVLPDGRLLVHSRNTTRFLTDVDAATWSDQQLHTVHPFDRTYPHQGSAVLLPLRHDQGYTARVLLTGGTSGSAPFNDRVPFPTPNTETCEILQAGSEWRTTGSMHKGRAMHDAVLLPDGHVLAIGGSAIGPSDHADQAVAHAEWFDPATEAWSLLGRITVPRGYHGTALLLPDGSVAVAGRDGEFQPDSLKYHEPRLEIFKPPYFYRGTRPTVDAVPAAGGYGGTVTVSVTTAAGLRDVVLLRTGAVTHGNNMDQRMITCAFTGDSGPVRVTLPPNAQVAPPGSYLMFAVDAEGRPSSGATIRLGA